MSDDNKLIKDHVMGLSTKAHTAHSSADALDFARAAKSLAEAFSVLDNLDVLVDDE